MPPVVFASPPSRRLRRVNNVLLALVIATNLYVISVPFLPQILFRVDQSRGKQQALEASIRQPNMPATTNTPSPATGGTISQGNHVVIPAMLLDQPIVEDRNMYRALDKGIWRWPGGSTPDNGGNTVLVGHRFTYTQPKGVFYFLDKLKTGDTVGIVWDGTTYIYRVNGSKVVKPTQVSILDPTKEPTLTMYTCTPLWLPKDRLVITATLETNGVRP